VNPLLWFLLQLLMVALPLVALARWGRTYPHQRLVLVLALPGLLALGGVVLIVLRSSLEVLGPLLALDGLILLIAALDLCTLPRLRDFQVERQAGRIASLQKKQPVALTLSYLGSRALTLDLRDEVPPGLRAEPEEFHVRVLPRSRTYLEYSFVSERRGAFQLPCVHLQVRSRLGLWKRYFRLPVATSISVYPDLKQVAEYALLARLNRLSLVGVRRTRRVGGDNEFERLRDYTRDDNYKYIDWRTTARRHKLTVKDFQTEQSQRVIFMLDCGRMMTNQAANLSLLDHSLNALLMLSYVALSHGDQVGLLTFSDEVHGFVPPTGGRGHINRLLHETFDQFPRLVESRYDKAFLYLGAHCKKRSMVILLTNLIDEVNGNQVERYLSTLVGRHLPLGVLLRDRRLFEFADQTAPQGAALYRAAAAAEILLWRHQVLRDLQSKGVLCLDVFPEDITTPLINQYLEIKARHLL